MMDSRSALAAKPEEQWNILIIDDMEKAARRMQTMVQGLLERSRVNTRGGQFERVSLTDGVAEVITDLEMRIQAHHGQVVLERLPEVEADELQMRQLFLNLISNALKFQKPDGSPVVRITGRVMKTKKGSLAVIQVEDNGIGFDPQDSVRIFQPFQQLHGKSEYEGTGLGLSICQRIVERHQGSIHVRSAPGEGSTFIISLPIRQPTKSSEGQ